MKEKRRTRGIAEMEVVLGNNDLLSQILVHLPARSLMRFKSVSKAWSSLISDRQFCIDHTFHNFSQNHYSVSEFFLPSGLAPYHPITYYSLHGQHDLVTAATINYSASLHIIHSCNGLFLCRNIEKDQYVVYNFTTQNQRMLPQPPNRFYYNLGFALAFDPSKPSHYKVVQFRLDPLPNRTTSAKTDIFSSDRVSWKEILVAGLVYDIRTDSALVFWNGAIHWISNANIHKQFQVDHEKFTTDPIMPVNWIEDAKLGYFGAVDHSLLLLTTSHLGYSQICSVLEMRNNSSGWALKYRVNFGHKNLSVLYVKTEAEYEHSTIVLSVPGKIISYYVVNYCEGQNNSRNAQSEVLSECKSDGSLNFLNQSLHPIIRCLAPV